jgi:tetratricopeptide (TPR) repeat protein
METKSVPSVESSDDAIRNDYVQPFTATAEEEAALTFPAATPKSCKGRLFSLRAFLFSRKIASWWKIATSIAVGIPGALTLAAAGYIVVLSLARNPITIEPLSTPKLLADNGYTPEIAAAQLRIALRHALAAVESRGPQMMLRAEQLDIDVPSLGLSAQTIANSIRKFLPISRAPVISGEFTITNGQLLLTLRSEGRDIYSSNRGVNPDQIGQLMDAAAPVILRQVWPMYLALTSFRGDPRLALEIADQIIATGSSSDIRAAFLLKGAIYVDQRNYGVALAFFTSALQMADEPAKRAEARIARGFVFQLRNNSKKAYEELAKAEELGRNDPIAIITINLMQKRRSRAAIELRKMVAKHALEPGAYNQAGAMFFQMRMFDEAITAYQSAIRLDPDDIDANVNLGTTYWVKGQTEAAAASYRKAIDIKPRDERLVAAYMNLGDILHSEGRFKDAAAEYREVTEMPLPTSLLVRFNQNIHQQAPSFVDNRTKARNKLGATLREQGKLDDAAAELTKNIEFEPQNAEARLELALVRRDQGKLDDAVVGLGKAIKLEPSEPAAHFYLGLILRDQGKLDESVAEFRQAIKAAPQDSQAYDELGLTLFNQNKTEEALSNIKTAINLNPRDPVAHLYLGIILRSEGKTDEAIVSLNEAARLGPSLSQPYRELATLFSGQGKFDKAIDVHRKAIERAPEDISAQLELVDTLRRQGDLDQAIAVLREILSRDTQNADYLYNLAATLTDKAAQPHATEYVAGLVEACKLLLEGKQISSSDPGFEVAIKRVDRMMPRRRHCRS